MSHLRDFAKTDRKRRKHNRSPLYLSSAINVCTSSPSMYLESAQSNKPKLDLEYKAQMAKLREFTLSLYFAICQNTLHYCDRLLYTPSYQLLPAYNDTVLKYIPKLVKKFK